MINFCIKLDFQGSRVSEKIEDLLFMKPVTTEPKKLYVCIDGPRYSGITRYITASSRKNSYGYYVSQVPIPLTYQNKKYELNFLEGKVESHPTVIPSAIVIAFDSTTRANYDEAKSMVIQGQKEHPKMPFILMANRCDLHRSLLFDAWPYVREILVAFRPGNLDSQCTLTELNYDVITVILEFLSDATIKLANYEYGALFAPTRNCSGIPISKWECRQFARKHEVGIVFTSSREVINIDLSHEIIVRKIISTPTYW